MPLLSKSLLWFSIGLLLCFFISFFSILPSPQESGSGQLSSNMQIRPATASDLDAITSLGLAALPDDPIWPYRFPGAKTHPDHHHKYSRIRFSEYLDCVKAGMYQSMLVEAPSKEDPAATKVIAMSMWILPGWHLRKTDPGLAIKQPSDHPERLDANPARMLEFRKQLREAKAAYFDQPYGDRQMNLLILATHPDYRRQGAGTMLVRWGMEKAARERVTLSLFSSTMGFKLYTKLGFQQVAMVHIQVEGEEAFVDLPAMVWEPPGE